MATTEKKCYLWVSFLFFRILTSLPHELVVYLAFYYLLNILQHYYFWFMPHEPVVGLDFHGLLFILQHYYFRFRPREPVVHLDFYGFLSAMFAIGLAIGVTIAVGMLFCIQVSMLWLLNAHL